MSDKFVNLTEARHILGVSRMTIIKMEKDGILVPYRTPGGHRRFSLGAIEGILKTKVDTKRTFEDAEDFNKGSYELNPTVPVSRSTFEKMQKLSNEVEKNEARYHILAESNENLVVCIDQTGRISYLNSRIIDFTGRHPEDLIGRPFVSILYFGNQDMSISKNIRHILNHKGHSDIYMKHRNGQVISCSIESTPLRFKGELYCWHCIIRNIGEKKRKDEVINKLTESSTMLSGLGKLMTKNLNISDISVYITESLMNMMDACTVSIMKFEDNTPNGAVENTVYGAFSNEIRAAELKDGYSLQRTALKSGRPLLLNNIQLTDSYKDTLSVIVVPLEVERKYVGALTVYSRREEPFKQTDQRLIQTMANFISVGICNTNLKSALDNEIYEKKTLIHMIKRFGEIAFELKKSHSVGDLCELTVKRLCSDIGFDSAAIFLVRDGCFDLEQWYSINGNAVFNKLHETLTVRPIPVDGDNPMALSCKIERVVIYNEPVKNELIPNGHAITYFPIPFAIVPIYSAKSRIGALVVFSDIKISREDLRLLECFSLLLGLTIDVIRTSPKI